MYSSSTQSRFDRRFRLLPKRMGVVLINTVMHLSLSLPLFPSVGASVQMCDLMNARAPPDHGFLCMNNHMAHIWPLSEKNIYFADQLFWLV